jgi:hypothetical protein
MEPLAPLAPAMTEIDILMDADFVDRPPLAVPLCGLQKWTQLLEERIAPRRLGPIKQWTYPGWLDTSDRLKGLGGVHGGE